MTDPLLGRVLRGRYRVERMLGQGGMGAVYAAFDGQLRRQVALKTLIDASDPRESDRFRVEAASAAGLSHPSVVEVLDFVPATGDEPAFLVMELLPGRSLARVLSTDGALPVPRALHVALQMLDAIGAAHRARILHRDIKPSNVIVLDGPETERPRIKIVDFGIAKFLDDRSRHTTTGVLIGTPPYMAPEQLRGERATERSDLYSIGVCLYEMLAGCRPFTGSGGELVADILRGEAPDLPLDPALVAVVRRAMHHVAAQRYGSADELASALRAIAEPRSPVAAPRSPVRWPLFAGSALATLAVGAAALVAIAKRPASPAPPPPQVVVAPDAASSDSPSEVPAPVSSPSAVSSPLAKPAAGVLSICSDRGSDLCARLEFDCECLDGEGWPVYDSEDEQRATSSLRTPDGIAFRGKECRGFFHGYRKGVFVTVPSSGRYSCQGSCGDAQRRAGMRIAVPGTPCVGYYADERRTGTWRAVN